MDEEVQFYLNFARHITDYTDYRSDLAWSSQERLMINLSLNTLMYRKMFCWKLLINEDILIRNF